MKYIAILLMLSLIGCAQVRTAVSGVDVAGTINNYEPITPILAEKATAAMVASVKKGHQIADDTNHNIIKELCLMEADYKEYWIKRQWRVNGIDYRRACDSIDGEITDPMP